MEEVSGRLTGSRADASSPSVSTKDFDPGRLLELAERCENATGPSIHLDIGIHHALKIKDTSVQPFTASLDAAMTLVPEGHSVHFETAVGASIVYANVWHDTPEYDGAAPNETRAATPALALCAAALKARAAQ